MTSLRLALALLVCLVAPTSAATRWAPPVTSFPARFATHETITAVGVIEGHGVTRRHVERTSSDDVLIFDDAVTAHLEDPSGADPPMLATWRSPARRKVVLQPTPETVATLKAALTDAVPFRMGVRVGAAHLTFSRDGTTCRGTQTIRCAGNYRGFHVTIVETMRYLGTRIADGPAAAAPAADLARSAAAALGRLTDTFR